MTPSRIVSGSAYRKILASELQWLWGPTVLLGIILYVWALSREKRRGRDAARQRPAGMRRASHIEGSSPAVVASTVIAAERRRTGSL